MLCGWLNEALISMAACKPDDQGVSIATHCLYPSFDPVRVHVSKIISGYHIHDCGGVLTSAWDHGIDAAAAIKVVRRFAVMNNLHSSNGQLHIDIPDESWLVSAVLTVANTSATAAANLLDRSHVTEQSLAERVAEIIIGQVPKTRFVKEFEKRGRSGKIYQFPFAIRNASQNWICIDSFTAHPVSVAAKYVSFSDTRDNMDLRSGIAIYEDMLDDGDAALLGQVADLLPFASLANGLRAELATGLA